MAEDRPATPEKQLLKLIQQSKNAKPGEPPASKRRISFSLTALREQFMGRISFLRRVTGKQLMTGGPALDIGVINNFLLALVVFFFAYLVFDAAASAVGLGRAPNFAFQKEKSASPNLPLAAEPLKGVSYYLEKASSRDIFREGPKPAEKEKEEAASIEQSEAAKSLSLVGISWSSNPEAMIENKSAQRTFFVKRGQSIGEVKVKAIFKDHVLLSCEGQEFELR